ncbi:hypothetical protein SAMN05421863_101646 [Nitrosomonas communis]|uniref:Uncharacterized protein n=1 Tax=Nitrosomonas communis TaxID=44574 RepID=A0A1I4NTZ1_9PROT|nr:hypothetical protein SAMN05421863_101646 [Nitrosomonas communis]
MKSKEIGWQIFDSLNDVHTVILKGTLIGITKQIEIKIRILNFIHVKHTQ